MKRSTTLCSNAVFSLVLSVLFLFGSSMSVRAEDRVSPMQKALSFFTPSTGSSSGSKIKSQLPHLQLKYRTKKAAPSSVFLYQKQGEPGFVLILQTATDTRVVGYSETGVINDTILPPSLNALIQSYEQISVFGAKAISSLSETKAVATPLLDEAGIALNQYGHATVGNCPTGCVATAMAQIMAYHKYPTHGIGSHCYTHGTYGQLCADFANTTYNWVNPTDDDYRQLSYHVGIAMDMNYCGASTGSFPSASNYLNTLHDYFNYSVFNASTATEDVMIEIDQKRPVYSELYGDPGHAVVIDGYNDAGYLHLNFGWGGQSNGYYLMNSNSTFYVGYTFGTNLRNVLNISKTAFVVDKNDSLALVALHNSLGGTTRWDLTKPVVGWTGVQVVGSRVVELNIGNSGFFVQGNIAPEIGNLPYLRLLSLYGKFNGSLPQSIFGLTKLRTLSVSNNGGTLTGTLPSTLGNLVKLQYLTFINVIEGSLPSSIENLKLLSLLTIANGKLSGSLPAGICNLPLLANVNLSSNQLSGAIPAQLGKITGMLTLDISNNQLSGSIPASMGRMTNLATLNLSSNMLTGNIPDSLHNLKKMTRLELKNNQLSGAVPPSIGSCVLLTTLDLSTNQLTTLPASISNLQRLQSLNLAANQFTTLPLELNYLPALTDLNATNNKISMLDDNFGAMKGIVSLDLSNNQLTTFPNGICYTSNLYYLGLSNNKISRFPAGIGMMSQKLDMLRLDGNELSGTIPAHLLNSSMTQLMLNNNRFRFEDIPAADSTFLHDPGLQKTVPLTKNRILVQMGDTVVLDAKALGGFSRKGNVYYWLRYPDQKNTSVADLKPDSVLKVVITTKTIQNKYICKVFNPTVPQWRYAITPTYFVKNQLMPGGVETDTITFKLATEKEILAEKYADSHVVISTEVTAKELGDKKVTLLAPRFKRGTLKWQASQDAKTWSDVSLTMSDNGLKQNISIVSKDQLVLTPKIAAYYRTMLTETGCEPLYGDTMKVKPFGLPVCDTTLNVTTADKTIRLDSIEVTVPKGLSNSDIRLTIVRADKFTVKPTDITNMSPVYEMSLSCGTTFDRPLIIKFKNLKKKSVTNKTLDKYRPAYFDDALQEWVFYDNPSVNMTDTTLTFTTYHLTKLAWFEIAHAGYTHIFTNDRVNVIYRYGTEYSESNYIDLYTRKAAADPKTWYTSNTDPDKDGTPYMMQDIGYYGQQIVDKFKALGLKSSSLRTNIYVKSLGGKAAGMTDAGSYLAGRGYMYIDPQFVFATKSNDDMSELRDNLRTTLAHEYMHLTQDYYMTVLLQNYFWMEATAPLADRMVWGSDDLKLAEPEKLLQDAYVTTANENSIFDILSKSWYDTYNLPVLSKLMANSGDINLESLFLHYMRSYRDGTKLDAAALLKETSYLGSWVGYLDGFIQSHMKSTIGTEYENYIKYIISGTADNFTLLNKEEGNPLGYIIKNVSSCPETGFGKSMVYQFKAEDKEPQVDKLSLSIPSLATKVVMLTNASTDRVGTIVQYKRLHSIDKECKVYFGQWNPKNKKVDLVEITDSLKYTTYLEPRTENSLESANNSAFLLFINKKSGGLVDIGNSFGASFELTAMPMANIADIKYVCVSDRFIHTYSNSSEYKYPFYISGVHYSMSTPGLVSFSLNDYVSNKTVLSDSTYSVNVSFKTSHSISNGEGLPNSMQDSEVTQHIEYNCSSGLLSIYQNDKTTNRFSAYHDPFFDQDVPEMLASNWVRKTKLVLKGVYAFSSVGNNELLFTTKSSAETKQVVQLMEDQEDETSYYSDGKISSQTSRKYVSTDYSSGEVLVTLWIHYK